MGIDTMTLNQLLTEQPKPAPMADLTQVATALETHSSILEDIRRELMKQNPDVLALSKIQGSDTIAASDTHDYRVFFEVGGKPVTAYRLLVFSTFSGTIAFSINSMSKINDGIPLGAGDMLSLDIAVDSIHLLSDGSAACPFNGNSDASDGGIFVYGFTIPDFERRRE